jgi:ribosomal protein S18 acetylase RimI-like enzyme
MNTEIKQAIIDEDILKCWPAIKVLRPHLVIDGFTDMVSKMQKDGYFLAFIEIGGLAVSVIGYRFLTMLYNGKQIYIDDLVTLEDYRGRGFARMLIDYVTELGKEKGIDCVTLDSGPSRHAAHRLYLNLGFNIVSYHFEKKLKHLN